jgi:chorismate mutase/prephenate dehydratase
MASNELLQLRDRINGIDARILDLFQQRMGVVAEIADYKREHGLPVYDRDRERENIERAYRSVPPELADAAASLQEHLMEAARSAERKRIDARNGQQAHSQGSPTEVI